MSEDARFRATLSALALLAAAFFLASVLTGPAALGFGESLRALAGGENEAARLVMQEIRLPRAILGALIGATLGLTGAALQGLLRNPLAEPGLLGVSAGASLGAVLAIYTGLSAAFALALPLAALGAAAVATGVVIGLAAGGSSLTLILAGVAVSSLCGALVSLALNLSPNPFAALEAVFWMLGSLADRSWDHVRLAAPFILLGWALLWRAGRGLDALTLGEDAAASMGVAVGRLRLRVALATAISVGAATAVAGAVGFVGLVAPHLLRRVVGARPSRLLPAAALAGASILLAADVAARLIAPTRDLKLAVLTALVGAPFFLRLVLQARGRP
jgi:iron complex transport system permease protein